MQKSINVATEERVLGRTLSVEQLAMVSGGDGCDWTGDACDVTEEEEEQEQEMR